MRRGSWDEDDYLDNWGDEIYSALGQIESSRNVSVKRRQEFLRELEGECLRIRRIIEANGASA